MISSTDPATGTLLRAYGQLDPAEREQRVAAAVRAQASWRIAPLSERTALLRRAAVVLRRAADVHARTITREMGKPLTESLAEIDKSARTLDYYADNAAGFLADEPIPSDATDSRVVFDPLGVVLAIMPWNYPFWQFFRFAAPALAAGNAILLKHASNVPASALAVQDVLAEAGAPSGLMSTLLVEGADAAQLVDDPRVAAVTLTGSTAVGREIAARAGAALKKQVLELGGSDPFIVLADADLERAASTAVASRFVNGGQSCVNAKRFIVEDAVADDFVRLMARRIDELVVGDPFDPATTIGPMARSSLRDELHRQVLASVAGGARLVVGGTLPGGPGAFYPPTLLDAVAPGQPAFDEETFGPVAAVVRAADDEEAIRLANATEYGLASTVWTGDADRGAALARRIDAGAVFVNGMVASDPRLPFGGIKASGYGRELGSFGIREFVNVKTVWTGPGKSA